MIKRCGRDTIADVSKNRFNSRKTFVSLMPGLTNEG